MKSKIHFFTQVHCYDKTECQLWNLIGHIQDCVKWFAFYMNVCVKNLEMNVSKSNNFGKNECNSVCHQCWSAASMIIFVDWAVYYKVDKMDYYLAAEKSLFNIENSIF
jgi:homoserine trans-succinylase